VSSLAPSADVSVSRWRTATIVASVLAVLELAVLMTIGMTHFARSVESRVREAAVAKVAGATPTAARKGSDRAVLPRSETGVLVLNGNGVPGAAAAGADQVRRLGYLVASVGNAESRQSRTLVMYRGPFRREALRLARDVHAPIVTPLDGMTPRELMGAQLVLLLGS
jgi:hypothetical protein